MAQPKTEAKDLKNVATFSPPEKGQPPRVIRDTDTKGLRVVIYSSGKRSFVTYYRNPKGLQRKYTLGSYPALSLTDARAEVKKLDALLEKAKTDPELAAKPEADPAALDQNKKRSIRAPAKDDDLYPAVIRAYLADYRMGRGTKAKKEPKENTIYQTARALGLKPDGSEAGQWQAIDGGLAIKWQNKRFAEITKTDVERHLDDLLHKGSPNRKGSAVGSPVTANRTFSTLKALFEWAERRNRISKRAVEIVNWDKAIEDKRERFLAEEEIRAFWQATGEMPYPAGPMFRVLLLTGQRAREVGEMKRSELDLSKWLWTIPGGRTGRTKNRQEHKLPLADDVRKIIEGLPLHNGDYMFSFDGGATPIKDYFTPKQKCLTRMEELLGRTYQAEAEKWQDRPWNVHDLRHTFSTLNNDRDPTAGGAVEAVLNHVKPGMEGKYNHAEYLLAKFNLLTAWEKDVRRIIEGRKADAGTDNALPFMRA